MKKTKELNPLIKHLFFFLLILFLLILRRPDQLFHPYVWDEDGKIFLQWLHFGLGTFIKSINDDLITIPKLINLISIKLSFFSYPQVSTLFALAFDYFVILMVAYSPTIIGWKKTAALAVILIPINAEVYLLPLYTFWFAGLLVFLSLLWRFHEDTPRWNIIRVIFMCIGGLSSPIIIILMPGFWLRFFVLKIKREFFIASLATVFSAINAWFAFSNQNNKHHFYWNLSLTIKKFFGWMFFYSINNQHSFHLYMIFTLIFLTYLIFHLWHLQLSNKQDNHFFLELALITFAIFAAIGASIFRVKVTILNPFFAGPRYFFYPYLMIAFFLCWIGSHASKLGKVTSIILLSLAFTNVIGHFQRTHHHFIWNNYAAKCLNNKYGYTFPILFDGLAKTAWHIHLTHKQCEQLSHSLFY